MYRLPHLALRWCCERFSGYKLTPLVKVKAPIATMCHQERFRDKVSSCCHLVSGSEINRSANGGDTWYSSLTLAAGVSCCHLLGILGICTSFWGEVRAQACNVMILCIYQEGLIYDSMCVNVCV